MNYREKLNAEYPSIVEKMKEVGSPHASKLKKDIDELNKLLNITKKTVRRNKLIKRLEPIQEEYYLYNVTPEKVEPKQYIFNNISVLIEEEMKKRMNSYFGNFAEVTDSYCGLNNSSQSLFKTKEE